MTSESKIRLKRQLAECLGQSEEIRKVVIFGSFLTSDSPNDIDVAVFLDRNEPYLPSAMKYRKLTRAISKSIPLDIFPVRPGASGSFLEEIESGETIFER